MDNISSGFEPQFDNKRFTFPENQFRVNLRKALEAKDLSLSRTLSAESKFSTSAAYADIPAPQNSRVSLYGKYSSDNGTTPEISHDFLGRSLKRVISISVVKNHKKSLKVNSRRCKGGCSVWDKLRCIERFLGERGGKVTGPQENLRPKIRYFARPGKSYPNADTVADWQIGRPLYKPKRNFRFFHTKTSRTYSQLYLCGRRIRIVPHQRGRDSVYHRYTSLCHDAGSPCERQRSPFPSIKDVLPYFEKRSPSASDVIKYLLEAHPAFQSPDGFRAATPAVAVGGEKVAVDTEFIHKLNAVLDDQRFARHSSTPDAKALTAARVTIHALENSGLVDSLWLLEHNPEAVLGEATADPEISSFIPAVAKYGLSPKLGLAVDISADTSRSNGEIENKAAKPYEPEKPKSDQQLLRKTAPENDVLPSNGVHAADAKQNSSYDTTVTTAEQKSSIPRLSNISHPQQETVQPTYRNLSKSLGEALLDRKGFPVPESDYNSGKDPDAARNTTVTAERRERFLSLKNELNRQEEQVKLEAIINETVANDNFAEVVRKRTLVNKRKREAGLVLMRRIDNKVDEEVSPPPKKSARENSVLSAKQKIGRTRTNMGSLLTKDSLPTQKGVIKLQELVDVTDNETEGRSGGKETKQQTNQFFDHLDASDSGNTEVPKSSLPHTLEGSLKDPGTSYEHDIASAKDEKQRKWSDRGESGVSSSTTDTAGQFKLPASVIRRTRVQQSHYRRLQNRLPLPNENRLLCHTSTARRYTSEEDWEEKTTESRQKQRRALKTAIEELIAHGCQSKGYEAANRNMERFPFHAPIFLKRAQLCEACENNRESALKDLGLALSLNGLNEQEKGDALLDRGLVYIKLGQKSSALRDIKESIRCNGHCPESALALAVYFYEQKEYFRSEMYFSIAISVTPFTPETLWLRYRMLRALALLLFRAQKYSMALDIWTEASVMVASPDSQYFLFSALCYRRLRDYGKADAFFRSYLSINPMELRNDRLRAIYVHLLLGDNDQAHCHLQYMDPWELFFNPKLLLLAARLFWTEGRFRQSRHCLQHCFTAKKLVHPASDGIDCGSRALLFLKILMTVRQRKYQEAFHLCKSGRLQWEDDYRFTAWFAFLKYECALEWEQKPSAAHILQQLTETNPGNCFIWYARARCAFYLRRNPRKSLTYLTTAIKLAPGFHAAYYFRACVRIRLGACCGAMKDIQRCCKAYPDSVHCWAIIGYCAVRLHHYKTALGAFLKTVGTKRKPSLNWLLLVRGWVFWKFGLHSEAMSDFIFIVKRFPNNAHAMKGLALTTWQCRGQRYVTSLLCKYQRIMDENPTLWVIYASSFFYQSYRETYTTAKLILQKIIHIYPQHYLARFNMGVVLYWEKQFGPAADIFQTLRHACIAITAGKQLQIPAYGALGISLFLTSQHRQALGILEAVANSPYLDEYFYVTFGYIRLVMKLPVEAEHAFHRACQLNPHNEEIRFLIGGLYILFNYAGKAVSYYTMVRSGNAGHIQRLASLNRCLAYKQLGLYKDALADINHLAVEENLAFQKAYRTLIQKLYLNTRRQIRKRDGLHSKC